MSEEPLAAAVKQSLWLLFLLIARTGCPRGDPATHLGGERYSKPGRCSADSRSDDNRRGRFSVRIGERRNDEIGRLYETFDRDGGGALAEGRARAVAAAAHGPRDRAGGRGVGPSRARRGCRARAVDNGMTGAGASGRERIAVVLAGFLAGCATQPPSAPPAEVKVDTPVARRGAGSEHRFALYVGHG